MTKFDGEEFIYGYPKDQLMLFALACREAGITNEKLHEINFNIEWAVDAVRKEVEEVARKNLDDIVNRITEQTEPQYEMGMGTLKCDNCSEYGSFKCTKCDGEMYFKDEPQTHEIRTNTHECVKDTHDKTEQTEREGE